MKHQKLFIRLAGMFILLSIVFNGKGQVDVDSLLNAIKYMEHDSIKTKTIEKYSDEIVLHNPGKAIRFFKQLLIQDPTSNELLLNIYKLLGDAHGENETYDSSIIFYNKLIEIASALQDSTTLMIAYNNIGSSYSYLSDNERALYYYLKSLKFAEDLKSNSRIMVFNNNIGILYQDIKDYRMAIVYSIKAFKISEELEIDIYSSIFASGLANSYLKLGIDDSSYYYSRISYLKALKANNKLVLGRSLNALANFFNSRNNFDSTIFYYKLALQLDKEIKNKNGQAKALLRIGESYIKLNNFQKAENYLLESMEIADSLQEKPIKGQIYNAYAILFEKMGNFKNANMYLKKSLEINDSIFNEKKIESINELTIQYETEKKEQQIALLEKEKELSQIEIKQKAQQRNWLIGFFAIMLIIAFIIFYYYRKTKAAKTKIEMLQREIHHRVKNNLSIIKRLVEVTQETIKDTKGRSSLNELSNRIASMAQVHSQLYQKEDITSIDFEQYVNALCENIKSSFSRKNLTINQSIEHNIDIVFNKAIPLGLIINELLTNAYKYAENGESGTKVTIAIKKGPDNFILHVSDNGQGFPENFDFNHIDSYGLKLVNGLVKQLNGKLDISHQGGANVKISIPD